MTSHDVVSVLRRLTGEKQIGHTGTLDPFAEGVLPVCIGKATRLIEYMADDKAYIGTVQFGKSTTTYDTEGEIVKTSDKKVTLADVEKALENFKGEIELNIIITGGNGKLGQNIVERLQKYNKIFLVTRDIKKTEKIFISS